MHNPETIQRFVHLRAQGLTFDRLAAELKVSKPTLIQWGRQHQFVIQNLRAVETEALAARHLGSRQAHWETLGHTLQRVETELAARNLSQVPTARLITLASALRAEANRQLPATQFTVPVSEVPASEAVAKVLDWQV